MDYLHWIFLALYMTLAVAAMVAILLDNRQPAKTMAWVLVLMFLPVVGIILYFFFGQNVRKERAISQHSLDQLSRRSMLESHAQARLKIPPLYQRLVHLFGSQDFAPAFHRNDTEIYLNGYEFFPQLLRDIASARDHIHLDFFLFEDDPLGRLVSDALIAKAAEGVEVRVIYDDVACWQVSNDFYERMRNEGIEVHAFMPVKFPAFTSKMNYRNHRKLCVVDGRVGFVGGMNIALRYVKGTKGMAWRDTHLKVEGGAVYGIQRAFLVDWYFTDRTLITDRKYYPPLNPAINNNCLAQLVTSSPVTPWPDIMQGYVRILLEAKRYVYMESPYFLPTEPILFAMRTAALAGVDVRLLIPRKSDSKVLDWSTLSYVMETLQAGVKVYLYQAGFNHSKLLVCDDSVSTVGSTNVDFRSFEHNFESNIFFYDEGMALRLKNIFMEDLTQSRPIEEMKRVKNRPFSKRLGESLLRLLSPLL